MRIEVFGYSISMSMIRGIYTALVIRAVLYLPVKFRQIRASIKVRLIIELTL